MRGGVALAAALALPLETASGAPFPARDTIVFLAFAVVVVTLLLEGLSLPWIIRRLGLSGAEAEDWRETEARLRAAEAALGRIDELAPEDWVREDTADRMRGLYEYRRRRFQARYDEGDGHIEYEERSADYQRLRRELLEAERASIMDLRQKGVIDEETMRRVERDLDLEDSRLEV
jgi:CPA1 family monovalent cation:H+ antiporter